MITVCSKTLWDGQNLKQINYEIAKVINCNGATIIKKIFNFLPFVHNKELFETKIATDNQKNSFNHRVNFKCRLINNTIAL